MDHDYDIARQFHARFQERRHTQLYRVTTLHARSSSLNIYQSSLSTTSPPPSRPVFTLYASTFRIASDPSTAPATAHVAMRDGFIARQRYSSLIPSQARESTSTPAETDELDTLETRRSRMTRIPGELPIPEVDMMCPPSLTSGASTVSGFYSPAHVLGTPQFQPETYQSLPICADPLDIRVEIALEPNGGDSLEMYGTSKTG